jgi:hypothetical protein
LNHVQNRDSDVCTGHVLGHKLQRQLLNSADFYDTDDEDTSLTRKSNYLLHVRLKRLQEQR